MHAGYKKASGAFTWTPEATTFETLSQNEKRTKSMQNIYKTKRRRKKQMSKIKELPMPDMVKAKLLQFGIKEDDIDAESALIVSLYKQALEGKVSAIKEMQKMLGTVEQKQEEKIRDITKEVAKEEKRIKESLSKLSKEVLEANKDFIHQLAFMSVTLKDLSDDIAKNGVKEKYYNGANQWRIQR